MSYAISEVSICNSALIKLGQERITSLTEDVKQAKLCADRYEFLRNEVLRAHPWSFALKRVELAALESVPTFEWDHEFLLPNDFIRLVRGEDWTVEYKIEGRKILANESTFKMLYVFEETNAANFDYTFAEALACRIAADIGYALTQSNTVVSEIEKAYEKLLKDARYQNAAQQYPEGPLVDKWINSRF